MSEKEARLDALQQLTIGAGNVLIDMAIEAKGGVHRDVAKEELERRGLFRTFETLDERNLFYARVIRWTLSPRRLTEPKGGLVKQGTNFVSTKHVLKVQEERKERRQKQGNQTASEPEMTYVLAENTVVTIDLDDVSITFRRRTSGGPRKSIKVTLEE